MNGTIRPYDVLSSPFIKVKSEVIMPGLTNGKPNIKKVSQYIVAPSAKKIATYIVNQTFGSEIVTQTEGLNVSWIMPTLKKALENAIYQEEAFIYLHKYNEKVYLECFRKTDLHDLIQEFDKVISCRIIQDFYDYEDYDYALERIINIENNNTILKFKAYQKSKRSEEYIPISINLFNEKTNHDLKDIYFLPYEVIVNIDLGMNFFKDSEKLLNAEMVVLNTIAQEIEKTKTRIVTTQHYQSNDLVSTWQPRDTTYNIKTINVNNLADFFTLLPGDKEHQMFNFLQGNIRINEYAETFKFYDYQCIQSAGLSPASFGYEKDAYVNRANIDLSRNASDMTIEAIKTQIEPQLNNLFENIIKLQQSQLIKVNNLPVDLNWNYGVNEQLTDLKKLDVLGKIEQISEIPYSYKAKVVVPILNKLIDDDYEKNEEKEISDFVEEWEKQKERSTIK